MPPDDLEDLAGQTYGPVGEHLLRVRFEHGKTGSRADPLVLKLSGLCRGSDGAFDQFIQRVPNA